MAAEFYRRGDYGQAREIYETLLNAGFQPLSTRLHLACVALMTDEFEDAGEQLAGAWAWCDEAHSYVAARMLWMRWLLDLLDGAEAPEEHREQGRRATLSALKQLLQDENVHMKWSMGPVLDHLRSRLSSTDHALLTALIAAMSSREHLGALEEFRAWREAP